jgi:sigma-B regulation protein RsbU (phosphoserine phosphatase)
MMKNWTFPAKRELLAQMLEETTTEIKKYFKDIKWVNRLKVCMEEILVNIIDYSGSKNVYISCEFLENEKALRFEFADEGTPYNPLENDSEVDIDSDIDERKIGGLGIFLYTTIMDKIEYRYENGKNILMTQKFLLKGDDKA